MITQTIPSEPPVQGGASIRTYLYKLKAFRVSQVLEAASSMCFGLVESRSNNTSNSISARAARNVQAGLKDIKRLWDWAKSHRDDPTGVLEDSFELQFPEPSEIGLMLNVKLRQVAFELQNFFRVTLGSQDATHGLWVGAETEADVDVAFATLTEIVTILVGDGSQDAAGTFNVGVATANYSHVGRLSPPLTNPRVAHAEPSSDNIPSRWPDAPDRESQVDSTSALDNMTTATRPPAGGASS